MSFILDALRKSEIERQRQSGPSMAEFPVARQDRRLPIALIAIGFLLAVNLAVVLLFLLRNDQNAEPASGAAQAAAQVTPAHPQPVAAAPASEPAEAAATPAGAAAGVESGGPGGVIYAPAEGFGSDSTLPPDAPDPTLLPEATPPAGANVSYGTAPGVEDAATVMAQSGLPPLTVDLHIFADDPAKRAVFINGRRYTQGATTAEGPKVETITREGAVLSYRGRRFLLPRL